MQAIKTIYNGVKYRSKLEARWSVFFDLYGLKYEYEPKTFRLNNGKLYCPDFILLDFDCYVEVKPLRPLTEIELSKLHNFELKIVLIKGAPLDCTWQLLHDKIFAPFMPCYPHFDRDKYWRWWYAEDAEDYPRGGKYERCAEIARYYDFFKF